MGTTGWRGMLAPLDVPTGDGRRILSAGIDNRELPLPLKWQREDSEGHDNSVIVGSLEIVNYGTVQDAIDSGWVSAKCIEPSKFPPDMMASWGSGRMFTEASRDDTPRLAENVAEALLLLSNRVIGPSVDLDAIDAVIAKKGCDEGLSDAELEELFWSENDGEDVELEMLFTSCRVAAATLVSIPAFAECRPFELVEEAEPALTAAVRKSGWSDLPLADRELEWDGPAAERNVADAAGIGGDSPDWGKYAEAFLYVDDEADPETKGAYGFPIADIIDGTLTIVPRGVFTVAGVLQGSMGGTKIPEADQAAMKDVVDGLYQRMAEEFDDPSIVAPWVEEEAAIIAAVMAPNRVYKAALFADPGLGQVTPLTVIEDEDGIVRVFGHVATHDVCHVGMPGVCTTAPFSQTGYANFNRYTQPEIPVPVGRITVGHGQFACTCTRCRGANDDHACLGLSAGGAIAHHDRLATVAWVCAGEDEANNAIWVSGVVNPDASVEDIASLAKARVSGDWRPTGGNPELVEILSLARERPGFPLPHFRVESGQLAALTAAGVVRTMGGTQSGTLISGFSPEGTPIYGFSLTELSDAVADKLAQRLAGDGPGYYRFDGENWQPVPTMAVTIDPPAADPEVADSDAAVEPLDQTDAGMDTEADAAEVDALLAEITKTADTGDLRAADLLRTQLEGIL